VFRDAEILRGQLLASQEVVSVEDFGAGSYSSGLTKERKIQAIARTALSPAFQCRWLFRIVQLYKPLKIIELGTSLGISTLYLTEGAPRETKVVTLEGSTTIATLARRHFDWYYDTFLRAGLMRNNPVTLNYEQYQNSISTAFEKERIDIVVGNFDETLAPSLQKLGHLDLAFIDGNHRSDATLRYFEQILPYIHKNSVLIFDDIHWSTDMELAWRQIQNHPSVRLTIDLFWCGVVFFRSENREREDFKLVKASWKPFQFGFWG
jgi:predicted O-methyltransferase YrrM